MRLHLTIFSKTVQELLVKYNMHHRLIPIVDMFVEKIKEYDLIPDRVCNHSGDGGASVYFFGGEKLSGGSNKKFVHFSFYLDGSIMFITTDRSIENGFYIEELQNEKQILESIQATKLFLSK